jgi:hypothetical protein
MKQVGAALAALGALVGMTTQVATATASSPQVAFEDRSELVRELPTALVFDLGVVDYDGDSDLDLFTTNHNDRGGLLQNRGSAFADRLTDAGLDQSRALPGFEIPAQPPMPDPGVYLFRTGGTDAAEGSLVLQVNEDPGVELSGAISFAFPYEVRQAQGAVVTGHVEPTPQGPRSIASFTTEGDARIVLEPEQMAAPIEVEIDPPYPAGSIFVGPWRSKPASRRFTLQLRDRHGIAWADFNRDSAVDAFIVRGGLKGRIGELADGVIADELMLGGGGRFADAIVSSGILKGECRGREADPVDVDRDARLDLFLGCQNAAPALFRQRRDGTFADKSALLSGVLGDHYSWLDIDGDGREELIASHARKLVVYRSTRRGRFKRDDAVRVFGESLGHLTYADFDGDADPDLFSPAPDGNTLLVNRSGRLRAKHPERLGLPAAGSLAASWLDYDNDSRLDLYAAPQGVFARKGGRRFAATGLAAQPATTEDALASWFDYDADGYRDLAVAIGEDGWEFDLLRNLGASTGNHWLQVELSGRRGSYPATGARVSVQAAGRRQTQWVGESDGGRYSRGHYRLYFGLGEVDEARKLVVRWADGSKTKLRDVAADRLLRVSFGRS